MTVIVEFNFEEGTPWWRPWSFRSAAMRRYGWGPVAITVTPRSLFRLLDDARAGRTAWLIVKERG